MGGDVPVVNYPDLSDFQYDTGFVDLNIKLDNGVALVTLYRPLARNAWTHGMGESVKRAFELFDKDDRVKVIVVTGHGSIYCAGADLNIGLQTKAGMTIENSRDGGGRAALAIHKCRKTTIAAINGPAVGIGMTITLPMGIRITYKDNKMAFPFVRRGVVPEATSSYFLPRLIGYSSALSLFLTGSTLAPTDHRLSPLFTKILDKKEDVLPEAMALARELADKTSIVSMGLVRALVWHDGGSPEAQHLLDSKGMFATGNSDDGREGVRSFLEKREPKFNGTINKNWPEFAKWWNDIDVRNPSDYKL